MSASQRALRAMGSYRHQRGTSYNKKSNPRAKIQPLIRLSPDYYKNKFTLDEFLTCGQNQVHYEPETAMMDIKFESALMKSQVTEGLRQITTDQHSAQAASFLLHKDLSLNHLREAKQTTDLFPRILRRLFRDTTTKPTTLQLEVEQKIKETARRACESQIKFNNKRTKDLKFDMVGRYNSVINKMEGNRFVTQLVHACLDFDRLRALLGDYQRFIRHYEKQKLPNSLDAVGEIKASRSRFHFSSVGLEVIVNNQLAYLKFDNKTWLLPRNYLQLIHNKLHDILCIMINSHFMDEQCCVVNFHSRVEAYLEQATQLYIEDEVAYFDMAKSLEGLSMAQALKDYEKWENNDYWDNIIKALKETLVWNSAKEIIRIFETIPTPGRCELSCLGKILGHPLLSTEAAARRVYERACNASGIDEEAVKDVVRHAKKGFLINHIKKHRVWPSVTIVGRLHTSLEKAKRFNMMPTHADFSTKHAQIPMEAYDSIEIAKSEDFALPSSLFGFLKDKAIALSRSEVLKHYFIGAYNPPETEEEIRTYMKEFYKKRPGERLILRYLLTEDAEAEFKTFFQYCNQVGSLCDEALNELVIKLTLKEKELKTIARPFGSQTFAMRIFNYITDSTVADYLGKYADYQALKISEVDLMKKLHSFVMFKRCYTSHSFFMISFDAKSWCMSWRDKTVRAVMEKTFDAKFGTYVFGKKQEIFEKSLVWLSDAEAIYYWDGQSGGIEGLAQYTWTYIYRYQAMAALKNNYAQERMLIKGDDLRIALIVDNSAMGGKSPKDFARHLMESFAEGMEAFGHEIKVEESYTSSRCLAFSKIFRVDDVVFPSILRKCQKIHGYTNALFPTIEDQIASIFSNAHSCGLYGFSPIGLYYTACLLSAKTLSSTGIYQDTEPCDVAALLQVPAVLGGFPIIHLHNMLIREESDHLTSGLEFYLSMRDEDRSIDRVFSSFLSDEAPQADPNNPHKLYVTLLHDPYAINLSIPQTAGSILRKEMRVAVEKMTKNNEMISLFTLRNSITDDDVLKILYTSTVWHAKVFSNLYACTPSGILDSLLRRFESASSIYQLFQRVYGHYRSKQIIKKVIHQDSERLKWRFDKLSNQSPIPISQVLPVYKQSYQLPYCSTELADALRYLKWGKVVESVTHPAFHHFCYLSEYVTRSPYQVEWSMEVNYAKDAKHIDKQCKSDLYRGRTKDSSPPFIGATTSKKLTTAKPTQFLDVTLPVSSAVVRLLELQAMTSTYQEPNSNGGIPGLELLISTLLIIYYPQGYDKLEPFKPKKVSGSLEHRMPSKKFKSSIVINVLVNIFNCVRMQTNTHGKLRGTSHNYLVNFWAILTMGTAIHELPLQFYSSMPRNKGFLITTISDTECSYCWKEIPDTSINLIFTQAQSEDWIHRSPSMIIDEVSLFKELRDLLDNALLKFYEDGSKYVIGDTDLTEFMTKEEKAQVISYGLSTHWISEYWKSFASLQERMTLPVNVSDWTTVGNLFGIDKSKVVCKVKHIRRFGLSEVVLALLSVFYQFCCRYDGIVESTSYMTAEVTSQMSEKFPWNMILDDLYRSRMLNPFLKKLREMSGTPWRYDVFFTRREAGRYVTLCLAAMCWKGDAPFPSYYVFLHHEGEEMVRDRINSRRIVKLWAKVEEEHRKERDPKEPNNEWFNSAFRHTGWSDIIPKIYHTIKPFLGLEEFKTSLQNPIHSPDTEMERYPFIHTYQWPLEQDEPFVTETYSYNWRNIFDDIRTQNRFSFLRETMFVHCDTEGGRRFRAAKQSKKRKGCPCLKELQAAAFIEAVKDHESITYYVDPATEEIAPQLNDFYERIVRYDLVNAFSYLEENLRDVHPHEYKNMDDLDIQYIFSFNNEDDCKTFSDDWPWVTTMSFDSTENCLTKRISIPEFDCTNFDHLLRIFGGGAPAPSRMESILRMIKFPKNPGQALVVFLGEGLGHSLSVFLQKYPLMKAYWNTLVESEDPITPVAAEMAGVDDRIERYTTIVALESDLMDAVTCRRLSRTLSQRSSFVYCDIALQRKRSEADVRLAYKNVFFIAAATHPDRLRAKLVTRCRLEHLVWALHELSAYNTYIRQLTLARVPGSSDLTDVTIVVFWKDFVDVEQLSEKLFSRDYHQLCVSFIYQLNKRQESLMLAPEKRFSTLRQYIRVWNPQKYLRRLSIDYLCAELTIPHSFEKVTLESMNKIVKRVTDQIPKAAASTVDYAQLQRMFRSEKLPAMFNPQDTSNIYEQERTRVRPHTRGFCVALPFYFVVFVDWFSKVNDGHLDLSQASFLESLYRLTDLLPADFRTYYNPRNAQERWIQDPYKLTSLCHPKSPDFLKRQTLWKIKRAQELALIHVGIRSYIVLYAGQYPDGYPNKLNEALLVADNEYSSDEEDGE